jgi:hypothetical protein
MDLSTLGELAISILVSIALLACFGWIAVWVPMLILGKAGFPRAYGCLAVVLGPIGLVIFGLSEWPILRELTWLRIKTGEPLGDSIGLAEGHAVDLEARGEWKRAIEVYEELARRVPDEKTANYYRDSSRRLRERMQETGVG